MPAGPQTLQSPSWPDRQPAVSVVVATCGRARFLPGLFDALQSQRPPPGGFEVVVIDDASTDDTWSVLADLVAGSPLAVRASRMAENGGQGAARTAGLGLARGRVVAFTDDDCLPTAGWLTALTAPVLAAGGAGTVAQGRTVPWPGDAAGAGAWDRTVWVLRPTWLFETCNVAYRRQDVLAAGGFPAAREAFVGPHGRVAGEDALLGWTVLAAGRRLHFEPSALVHHRHLPAGYRDWVLEQWGRSVFCALAGRGPFGRRPLWGRWFLAPRSAAWDLAVLAVGAAVLTRRTPWLAGVAPWMALALPDARSRGGRPVPVRLAQLAVGDAVGMAALAVGSWRHRQVVL